MWAESGVGYYVDAVYGVGPGLLLGDGDVPQLDYVAGGALETKHGEDAGELALGASTWRRREARVIPGV